MTRLSNEELARTAERYDKPGFQIAHDVEIAHFRDLYEAAPSGVREQLGLTVEHCGASWLFVARGLPHLFFNRASLAAYDAELDRGEVARVMDAFADTGAPNFVLHVDPEASHDGSSTLLRDFGLMPFRRPWVKLLRGDEPVGEVECDLSIAEVGPEQAELWASMFFEVFALPRAGTEIYRAAVGRSKWRCYLASSGDEPAAAGALFIEGDTAYLAGGVTLPQFRRRSAQRALMTRRIADALAAGCKYIATETGVPIPTEEDPSYRNMLHMGFRAVGTRHNYAPEGTRW